MEIIPDDRSERTHGAGAEHRCSLRMQNLASVGDRCLYRNSKVVVLVVREETSAVVNEKERVG